MLRKILTKLSKPSNVKYYHSRIINHYENPRNIGSLDKNDKNVVPD